MSESTIEMILEITGKQDDRLERLEIRLEGLENRLEQLEKSMTTLINGQNKLITLVEKVFEIQDEQKDLLEALAVRSTYQDAEILRIKKAR